MSQLKWYVVRIVSGQENKVKTYLENEIFREKLESYIPQILIPKEKVYEIRNGKKIVREKNRLPGYILLQADLETNGEVIPVVNSIPGIINFLLNMFALN